MIIRRDFEQFDVPERLPVLPLRDVVLFPHVVMPLLVGRPASLGAVDAAQADEGSYLLVVAQKNAETPEPAPNELFRVGIVVRLAQVTRLAGGTARVLMEAVGRVRITRYATSQGYLRASTAALPFSTGSMEPDAKARARQVLTLFEEYVALHRRLPQEVVAIAQAANRVSGSFLRFTFIERSSSVLNSCRSSRGVIPWARRSVGCRSCSP